MHHLEDFLVVLPHKLTVFLIKSFCESQLNVDIHRCKEDFQCSVVLQCVFLTFFPVCLFCCQFYIVKENRGNEGTCVGVSRWPVHDFNHRTTSDMWLYRAYSGNLYHNGEQTLTLSSFTQGDFITCVLDMEARTISFGKNGEVFNINSFF